MSPILSGFMISSTLRRGSHLVLSFSVVFLYWFCVFSILLRMGLPFGTSSSSSHGTQSAGSEGDMELQARMDLKRKRRMENRRSTKIARSRKQRHLDDLISQVDLLTMENQRLITVLNITAQSNAAGEAQNSVLRTQMMELENRLRALHDFLLHECKPVR